MIPNLQKILLYIPGIKGAVLGYYYTNMAQIAYLHLKHGHSLLYSLQRLQKAFELDWMGHVLGQVIPEIEQGVSLTAALKSYPGVFSKFFLQLIDVGEKTNTLQENFKVISAYYERDTKKRITDYIKLIEPLMLIIMGILLIVIVGGLFYPMYSQMGLIGQGGL
jgi:type II secretory pathway component PulF